MVIEEISLDILTFKTIGGLRPTILPHFKSNQFSWLYLILKCTIYKLFPTQLCTQKAQNFLFVFNNFIINFTILLFCFYASGLKRDIMHWRRSQKFDFGPRISSLNKYSSTCNTFMNVFESLYASMYSYTIFGTFMISTSVIHILLVFLVLRR